MKVRFYLISRFVLIFLISFLVHSSKIVAQDIEGVIDNFKSRLNEEPIKLSGGISAGFDFSYASGIANRQLPLRYRFNANFAADILGVKIPVSANLSNGGFLYNYKLPSYAFVGISPKYKWATLHLGDRSMNFSPYTLAGHSFYGIGTEIKPDKVSFEAMYGRLRRASIEDLNSAQNIDPAYKRMGLGFKLGYDNGEERIYAIYFKGWDDPTSAPTLADSTGINAADNVILSLQGTKKFGDAISLDFDYARSAYSHNILSDKLALQENQGIIKTAGGTYTPRTSTRYSNAFNTTINYSLKKGEINLKYERVDPGYRTLGALFFNDDFENFTSGLSSSILKRRLNFALEGGVQRNNIIDTQLDSDFRFIGSANIAVNASKKLNFNLSYSNFTNTSKQRAISVPFIEIDSIILTQVNQNANFSSSYSLKEDGQSIISAMIGYQKSNNIENDVVLEGSENTNFISNLSYIYANKEKKISYTGSLLFSTGKLQNASLTTFSPTISIRLPMLSEKIETTGVLSFVNVFNQGEITNQLFSLRSNFSMSVKKKHNLSLAIGGLFRNAKNTNISQPKFFETTGGLNYNLNFSGK